MAGVYETARVSMQHGACKSCSGARFFVAKMELFELKGDVLHSPGRLQVPGEAPGGRWR
jgi:hypothetical protein